VGKAFSSDASDPIQLLAAQPLSLAAGTIIQAIQPKGF
jgi:hypothetical protein